MTKAIYEEEGIHLRKLFGDTNRAEFARQFGIKGGPTMIFQHIEGIRPIGLDAAIIYAKGLKVSLDEVSPRLADQIRSATKLLNEPVIYHPKLQKIIDLWPAILPEDHDAIVSMIETLSKKPKPALIQSNHKRNTQTG